MKKQYIKFIEWDKKDLARACKLAEKHWYKKWSNSLAFISKWFWILVCGYDWDYFMSGSNEDTLIFRWYTELKEKVNLDEIKLSELYEKFNTWNDCADSMKHSLFNSTLWYTPKYFVITEWKSAPQKIHTSLKEAQYEAKRLAKLENRNTYVVEIKHKYWAEIKELTI